jgi:hypothetical protein
MYDYMCMYERRNDGLQLEEIFHDLPDVKREI